MALDEIASLTNAGHGPLKVPGFGGIPLDFELPLESRFAHGLMASAKLACHISVQEPFGMADSTRPGNLTIVKIRLVDPHYRICSTRNVPPQQHDWWTTEAGQAAGLDKSLPAELVQLVMKETDRWPISREVAERLREELRRDHERKRKAVDLCVGHHLVSYIPYDAATARDATDSSGVGYESL